MKSKLAFIVSEMVVRSVANFLRDNSNVALIEIFKNDVGYTYDLTKINSSMSPKSHFKRKWNYFLKYLEALLEATEISIQQLAFIKIYHPIQAPQEVKNELL